MKVKRLTENRILVQIWQQSDELVLTDDEALNLSIELKFVLSDGVPDEINSKNQNRREVDIRI